jgi:DNA ligase D-like protein (predicted polymerase)
VKKPADEVAIEVSGRELRITSASKVMFDERGDTKLDLVEYYLAIEEPIMRAVRGRPVLMQRFPHGASGSSFFQKRVPDNAPEWLETTIVSTPNGTTSRALVAADLAHLLWAVNLGCLGFHVWPYRASDPEHADELRLDLDPQPGVDFEAVRVAAREVNTLLSELGVTGYPKTTGNRGIHVYVRLEPVGMRTGAVGRGRGRAAGRRRPDVLSGPRGGRRSGAARVHRLQPEHAAQDRVRGVVGAGASRRAGLDTVHVGRA